MYPLLFILFMDGLSFKIREARDQATFLGIRVTHLVFVTHIFFVDDALTFVLILLDRW